MVASEKEQGLGRTPGNIPCIWGVKGILYLNAIFSSKPWTTATDRVRVVILSTSFFTHEWEKVTPSQQKGSWWAQTHSSFLLSGENKVTSRIEKFGSDFNGGTYVRSQDPFSRIQRRSRPGNGRIITCAYCPHACSSQQHFFEMRFKTSVRNIQTFSSKSIDLSLSKITDVYLQSSRRRCHLWER